MNFNPTSKQTKIILFVFVLALLGGIGYGGHRYWQSRQSTPGLQEPPVVEEPKPTPITEPTDDPNWNLYTNGEYGFTVEYPAGWEVSEKENLRGGTTTYFSKKNTGTVYASVWETPETDVLEWLKTNWRFVLRGRNEDRIPNEINAKVAGSPAVVVYDPQGPQAPSEISTVLKYEDNIFVLSHYRDYHTSEDYYSGDRPFYWKYLVDTNDSEKENEFLWDEYQRFLETFEFGNTQGISDEIPNLRNL